MATATASKPKAPRTIVSTKVTATGVELKLAASVVKQLAGARELCRSLEKVPEYGHYAAQAIEGISGIIGAEA